MQLADRESEIREVMKMRDASNSELDTIISKYDMLKKNRDQIESERLSISKQVIYTDYRDLFSLLYHRSSSAGH